jgi:flagellar biosynthesis protein FlhG
MSAQQQFMEAISADIANAAASPAARGERRVTETPTVVVGSGKGGVGKSLVSVLLASELASQGRRVLLLDGAQNMGNLHVLLGVRPGWHLDALLGGEVGAPDLVQSVAANLWLLPGESGNEALYAMESVDRARVQHRLSELYASFDAAIVDAGAGIESVVRAATMRATRLLVVTAPEPTALTDAYALMKIVNLQIPGLPMDIVVNRCLDAQEGRDAFVRLATACARFLRRGVRFAGALPEDQALRLAVRDPHRLLETIAATTAAGALRKTVLHSLDLPVMARSAV